MTRNVVASLILAGSLSVQYGAVPSPPHARQTTTTPGCTEPLPRGFTTLDDRFWDGPWAFDSGVPGRPALPAAVYSRAASKAQAAGTSPLSLRLDDGSVGSLRIEQRACGATEPCAPRDCGCPLDDESFWIVIADARGSIVARMHLWAAYGRFQVIPVDLVDGAGDELLIVRVPAHASPPIGYDLKIWKVGVAKPLVLTEGENVAGTIVTTPIACARWRTHLFIDRGALKPRSVLLRTEIGSSACCRIADEDESRVAGLRTDRTLQYAPARGGYVVR